MDMKNTTRPEDIIVGTDPVAIDIIQQIYAALKDKNEADRTFLERCWVLGIEKAYKTNTRKLDPELCTKLLERIYFHLEHKNIWDVDDDRLYDIFEKIISLKTIRDSNVKEIFDDLESALGDVLQLDFSHKVSVNYSRHEKRNIFNYIVFLFNSIIEKIETSMVSAKAVNTFFTLYPQVILIVTDKAGKVRFMNQSALALLGINDSDEGYTGLNIKNVIKDYNKLALLYNKKGEVKNYAGSICAQENNDRTHNVRITIPPLAKGHGEIDEIVYVVNLV